VRLRNSPRWDDGNNHGDGSISGGDDVSQRERPAEAVVGEVWGENKSLSFLVYRQ
jgi:hypothetical protein